MSCIRKIITKHSVFQYFEAKHKFDSHNTIADQHILFTVSNSLPVNGFAPAILPPPDGADVLFKQKQTPHIQSTFEEEK
jgi:hypothetical protein